MNKFVSTIVSSAASASILFLFAFPAAAQDDVDLGPPLTQARAESFVACLGDIMEIGEKYEGNDAPALLGDVAADDVGGALAAMKAHPAYNEITAAFDKHGFEGPEEWAQTSRRFLAAYSALKLDDEDTNIDAQMAEAISQIRTNTMLTDEQKDQMIEMIKSQQQLFENMQDDASAADKAAVLAVIEDFEALSSE